MKNTLGNSVALTLFGESHGDYIGAVLDGLAPGIPVDLAYVAHALSLRRPSGRIATARREKDEFSIVSGVFNGYTTGTPLTVLIPNENTNSGDYVAMRALARPSHADFTAQCKYHGFQDVRGGGHFSGRITAALVAAGAICRYALERNGIRIGTHVKRCAGIEDGDFSRLEEELPALWNKSFAVLDEEKGEQMRRAIEKAASQGDSVGGVLETVVTGMPAGVGEPWFDTLEGMLSHALFSIPAVKGVEFGDGFALADGKGSQLNDPFRMEGDRVVTLTNHNGGINGGITNGMPLLFRTAVKPTPTIFQPQETVDLLKRENAVLEAKGRHDPAIVHRARAVQDATTALVLCDALAMRFGTDHLAKKEKE